MKNLDKSILGEDLSGLKIEKLQPHWMPENNVFCKIEKEGQVQELRSIIQKHDRPLFEGAAEGIIYLRNHAEH